MQKPPVLKRKTKSEIDLTTISADHTETNAKTAKYSGLITTPEILKTNLTRPEKTPKTPGLNRRNEKN